MSDERRTLDMVIVGAGFAGMYMLHEARRLGLSCVVLEAGAGVGGTWYWNRYPGARCDIESMEYSYGFDEQLQQEWEWSERYAPQPEILRYAEHVADRFDLRRDIRFETRVTAAVFDDATMTWRVTTDAGEEMAAQFVVMATGCLSAANVPGIDGADTFAGPSHHTGRWPHEGVDFSGQRVGVIGTGSSAIQSIPIIAEQAGELVVFQRTASYSVPAWNRPLDRGEVADIKARYREFRQANAQMNAAFGSRIPAPQHGALEVSDQERLVEYQARAGSGVACRSSAPSPTCSSTVRRTRRPQRSSAPGSTRSSTTPRWPSASHRTRSWAASGSAWTPATTPRSTGPTCASSTCARRPSRQSPPPASAPATRSTRSTPSSTRTGFDAMTGSAGADRHPRSWRHGPAGRLGGWSAHLPRAGRRRLPEPLHDHRTGQPLGAHQHAGVDRAARRVDRRLRRPPAPRRSPSHRAHARGAGGLGRLRQHGRPASRCSPPATPGTWAPTCRARRGCSCRSPASPATSASASRSRRDGYDGFTFTRSSDLDSP